jgi:hypothetical protein
VAGDDVAVLVDQDGIDHAVAPHAASNLPDLFVRVGPGILGIRNQALDRPVFMRLTMVKRSMKFL